MMTPVREFLYFLVILILFGAIQLVKQNRSPKTVAHTSVEKQLDSTETTGQKRETIENVPILAEDDRVEPKDEAELFHSTPFLFAPDDSIRFQYLVDKLRQITKERLPVRIVYFGDSQVENDRITSSLRKELQDCYGGKGPGFVPLDQYYNTNLQLIMDVSKSWNIKSFQDTGFVNQSLLFKNALLTADDPQGWFRIRRIHSHSQKTDYTVMKLYYWATDSCKVTVRQDRDTIFNGSLLPENKVSTLDFQFNRTPDDVRVDLYAKDTLNILGLSLETKSGVLVDNVALRGQSYPLFEWSDKEKVEQMLDQVNVGLFVLHFGVNLVPYASKDYHYFRLHFQRQIDFLKHARPEVPILIVGVSDMAERLDGSFVSYSTIPEIKSIEQEIAFDNKAAFWDLQAFMGGDGGVVNWVEAKPPLARKDYVHFSKRGAAAIGKELGQLILDEMKNDSIANP